ncbi:MAG: protein translocase subunit SecF [Clostridia bacterium]
MINIEIIKHRKIFYIISAIVFIVGILSLSVFNLNLGIDFSSGTILEVSLNDEFSTGEIREIISNVDLNQEPVIREVGDSGVVQIKTESLSSDTRQELIDLLRENYPDLVLEKADQVDPVFGQELARQALFALVIAMVLMVVYITWRFEFKFAIAAILALIHDALFVLAVFSIAKIEINSEFIAAILLIIGYSINDTIVIFDRVRENLKQKKRDQSLEEVVNTSLQQTLLRSINTSLTTLLAVGAILFFGGTTLRMFSLALFLGIISGTYSSIFFASPVWLEWKLRSK